MKRLISIFIVGTILVAISACKDNNNFEKLRKNELAKLNEYLDANYPKEVPKPSGLYFIPVNEGVGDSTIRVGDQVKIYYATWLIDSTLIDQTTGYLEGFRYEPYEFIVGAGNSIAGLEEAVTYMKKGGIANLIIPSELAYKQTPKNGVPAFSTLLMQVEIYKVYRP
ncbi:MAG: hypothetical protein CR996_01900 [Draconibacterium sp.]|nr:MAG: hypothetical protein CR996_01900 [Draconibacterium sp.]PIF06027.1 MAG: hypothetical protein CSA36_03820 [Draconibacterium sp.]